MATAASLAEIGRNVPFAFNRKEAKDHGEGGSTIGAPIRGRVMIVDDVISAGTSVRESVELIRAAGAVPAGVVIALDRQERGQSALSATQEVHETFGIPVFAICTLTDVIGTVTARPDLVHHLQPMRAYRQQYGVAET